MEKRITISFPGKKRVDASMGKFTIQTDQLPRSGGDGSAPQPFDLFFVSLATCAGISALDYAQEHALPTDNLGVTLVATHHASEPRYDKVRIEVTIPDTYTEQQTTAILEEVEDCSVKQHILNPPTFEVVPLVTQAARSAQHDHLTKEHDTILKINAYPKIKYRDIEDAFLFVSGSQPLEHIALLDRSTGKIHCKSEYADLDEIPEDLWDSTHSIEIPHKYDLNLGQVLVHQFIETCLPDETDHVYNIFRRRGAYSRFKGFLEDKDMLQHWYDFENEMTEKAIREWCKEEEIELVD